MTDKEIKQAFIAYLEKSYSERFFQALTSFTQLPYIGVADKPDGQNFRDLWNVEADTTINWEGKS